MAHHLPKPVKYAPRVNPNVNMDLGWKSCANQCMSINGSWCTTQEGGVGSQGVWADIWEIKPLVQFAMNPKLLFKNILLLKTGILECQGCTNLKSQAVKGSQS